MAGMQRICGQERVFAAELENLVKGILTEVGFGRGFSDLKGFGV